MPNTNEPYFASIIHRYFNLLIFTLLYLFLGYAFIENKEIAKLLPPTLWRSVSVLFGYFASLATINYYLANKAKNCIDWATEIKTLLIFCCFLTSMLGPKMFAIRVEKTKYFMLTALEYKSNYFFILLLVLIIPLSVSVIRKLAEIKRYAYSRDLEEEKS